MKIHVGQTGTTDDMVTREFVGNISGLSTIGLSVNVTLGADNDTATMEVIGPDGQSTIVGQQVRPPKLAATRTRAELEPIILAKARALTIAYWQERLSDAHSEEEIANAQQKLAALGTLDGVSGGVGSTTDTLTEEEKVLVAMVGERLFPDLGWAEGTVKTTDVAKTNEDIEKAFGTFEQQAKTALTEQPNSSNTMILVFYGSGQFPGDGEAGFDKLITQLQQDHDEVWAFESGQNLVANPESNILSDGITASEALRNVETFVNARLQNNPQLTNVILVGYSWGGGMAYKFSNWMAENHGNIAVIGSAYVDAVTQGNLGAGFPEPFMPVNTLTMLNVYQSNVGIVSDATLNGMAMNNNELIPMIQIDFDGIQDSQTHSTIDEYARSFVLRYISSLIP